LRQRSLPKDEKRKEYTGKVYFFGQVLQRLLFLYFLQHFVFLQHPKAESCGALNSGISFSRSMETKEIDPFRINGFIKIGSKKGFYPPVPKKYLSLGKTC
jgi:hypothetical protein